MIVTLIVVCEIGFWVLLAAGLAFRYLAKMPRTGLAVLLCEPLLEVVLLVVTAMDLKNGAEPSWKHGLAALYIGYTVGHGHPTVKWVDGHAAHRLAGAARPVGPPRYGMARARHEGKVWLGPWWPRPSRPCCSRSPSGTSGIRAYGVVGELAVVAWRAVGIHGVIALTYLIWPKKAPEGSAGEGASEERSLTKK